MSVVILGAAVVGLLTIDFDDEGDGVATGPGDTTTTLAPSTTPTTTATTAFGTTATTAPATTAPPTTAASVGGTATTLPGTGLGTGGAGQVGQEPLATSGGEDMLVPAALLGMTAWALRAVRRRVHT